MVRCVVQAGNVEVDHTVETIRNAPFDTLHASSSCAYTVMFLPPMGVGKLWWDGLRFGVTCASHDKPVEPVPAPYVE